MPTNCGTRVGEHEHQQEDDAEHGTINPSVHCHGVTVTPNSTAPYRITENRIRRRSYRKLRTALPHVARMCRSMSFTIASHLSMIRQARSDS